MDLLAYREHGRLELTRKLCRRGAPPELVETVLDQLTGDGLLSEARYLEAFIASRARAGYGPLRIREELAQRGLPRPDIEQALLESGVDWAELLTSTWQRKFAGCRPSDNRERTRQGRFLSYRGFPAEMIGRLLRNGASDDY